MAVHYYDPHNAFPRPQPHVYDPDEQWSDDPLAVDCNACTGWLVMCGLREVQHLAAEAGVSTVDMVQFLAEKSWENEGGR